MTYFYVSGPIAYLLVGFMLSEVIIDNNPQMIPSNAFRVIFMLAWPGLLAMRLLYLFFRRIA